MTGWRLMPALLLSGAVLAAEPVVFTAGTAVDPGWLGQASGAELLAESVARHRLRAGLIDELSMIVSDAAGHRQTRALRVHRRDLGDGARRYWLRFDGPPDLAGVTLVAERRSQSATTGWLLLPALGSAAVPTRLGENRSPLPGSDLQLQDFDLPDIQAYRVERRRDRRIDGVQHLVVDLYDRQDSRATQPRIRMQLLAETLSVVRTSHYDHAGRVIRVRTAHDLRPLESGGWWPAVIRIEDRRSGRDTLLRVVSRQLAAEPPELAVLAAVEAAP